MKLSLAAVLGLLLGGAYAAAEVVQSGIFSPKTIIFAFCTAIVTGFLGDSERIWRAFIVDWQTTLLGVAAGVGNAVLETIRSGGLNARAILISILLAVTGGLLRSRKLTITGGGSGNAASVGNTAPPASTIAPY